jgi:hypothetical protein
MDQRDRDVLRALRALAFVFALLVTCFFARTAKAEVVRLVPAGVEATPGRYASAASSQDAEVRRRGAELELTVSEALEDMGLEVEPSGGATIPADGELGSLAHDGWVVAPRIEVRPEGALVRIVALPPGSRVLLVREEDLDEGELKALAARAVVMVRDIVESGRRKRPEGTARPSRVHPTPPAPQSSGRPVLALNSALYGGYLGFTMHRASDSSDSRLVYPMMALGAGLGLGASLLVADEWNVTQGEAWYLAAGLYWPGASGFLISNSYRDHPEDPDEPDNRYTYGLVGATAGLSLATVAVATSDIGEGGAVLTHSGGAFGMLFGAMTEVFIEGKTEDSPPTRGMGYGTGAGVLAAGVVATQVDVRASRMLFIDLSASLGALGGAALASPLVFVDEPDAVRTRLWLGAVAAGTIAGGVVGWYLTDKEDDRPEERESMHILPYASQHHTQYGESYDVGVVGTF